MSPVPKKFRPSQYRLAQTGIPDFANKNREEQVALFSKLLLENSQRSIYEVWSNLDPADHSFIMSVLGFFEGKVRAQYYAWAREDAAELKRHTRMLRTFLEKRKEHESIRARRPRYYAPRQYNAEREGICTLRKLLEIEVTHLKTSLDQIHQMLRKLGKWDTRGMIRAQEYVKRRANFLGLPRKVRLTPEALTDLYELTQPAGDGGDKPDTAENIRKAISSYRKNDENAYFIQNIEFYLEDWTKLRVSGN